MVNENLVEAILREQDDPGCSTTRKIREIYNQRSGDEPIVQHSEDDKLFQTILLKTLEKFPTVNDEDDQPISYTVKLKDGDESSTPTIKRRSIIKLSKTKDESESEETSSDSDKPSTTSSITITKPFSPLFFNNMKKFGVSTDWLAKRSNSLRQSSYSRSSIKSNTSQLDEMIKNASAKPIRSNRKLSFIETKKSTLTNNENDKENQDPLEETKTFRQTIEKSTPYDLSSENDEDKDIENEISPKSKEFSLKIPRVNLPDEEENKLNSSSNEKENDQTEKDIEHLKKLLRISGIRIIIRKTELENFSSNEEKIKYLKSIFHSAGFNGNLTIKNCEKFRKKRETEKELNEIQMNFVHVKGHVKGGRTLRGEARETDQIDTNIKRKRRESSEIDNSSDDEKLTIKKRRIIKMEASPEVSESE